ncbi:nucleotidyltransferase family protein [Bdellovibrionota bacterium FG-2]
MKRDEVLQIISSHQRELSCFKVKSLAIFGSVARDQARKDSDVDLLVEFSEPVGIFEFIDLKEFLEKILGNKVDLATEQALKKQLRDQILKEAIRAA